MGHGAYPQHECLNKERSDITYTHFLTNWFRLEINVGSWLVPRVAIVAIFFQIILKLMYCLEGSLLWQNKIGENPFFAKKTVIAERHVFLKNAVAQSR